MFRYQLYIFWQDCYMNDVWLSLSGDTWCCFVPLLPILTLVTWLKFLHWSNYKSNLCNYYIICRALFWDCKLILSIYIKCHFFFQFDFSNFNQAKYKRRTLTSSGDLDIYSSGDKIGSSLRCYSDERKHPTTPLCSSFKYLNGNW